MEAELIILLLVYCFYDVTAYDKNYINNYDDITYQTDDGAPVDDFTGYLHTESPLHPYTRGPPNVAFIIIDVQVS